MAQDVVNRFGEGGGAPVIPHVHGGSKWAHLFSGKRRFAAREIGTVLHLNALCQPDGTIADPLEGEDAQGAFADTAFPLQAGPGLTLGQFLTGALPGIVAQRASWENGRVACAAPTTQQRDVLRRLGLLDGYVALAQPVRFRLVVGQAGTPPRPAPAGQAMQDLFDKLRAPAPEGEKKPVAILPNREREVLALRNRASLTAWLRARRMTILDPDRQSFEAVAAALAGASVLVLADPAQAGLFGLCAPGTKLLEIAPEGFAGMQAREICAMLGGEWALVLGGPPSYPLTQPLAFGASVPLSYEVPINAVHGAMSALAR